GICRNLRILHIFPQNPGTNPGIDKFQTRNPGIGKSVRDCKPFPMVLNFFCSLLRIYKLVSQSKNTSFPFYEALNNYFSVTYVVYNGKRGLFRVENRSRNPGTNPGIPGLTNFNPEIPGFENRSGIANPTCTIP